MNVEIVPNAKSCQLGEGPHWSSTEGVLYYVDIPRGRVLRYDPLDGGSCNFVDIDGGKDPVSFVIPSIKEKEFLIGKGRDLCRLQWDFKQNDGPKLVKMVEVDVEFRDNRFNDGKCDFMGRLWAGTMGKALLSPNDIKLYQGSMYLFCQNPNDLNRAIVDCKFDKVHISNGLDWSPDGKTMYYIDSLTRKIDGFDFDAKNGSLANRRTVFDLSGHLGKDGFPDGMTIDTKGHLWVACWGESQILKIDPVGEEVLSKITFHDMATNITSCTFGGPELKDLYVTSALDSEGKGGQLFVIRNTGAQGLAGRSFDPTFV